MLKRADFVMPDDESRTNCHIREAHFTGESYKPGEELKVRMKHKKNKSLEEHAVPTINPPDPRKFREKRKDDGESSNEQNEMNRFCSVEDGGCPGKFTFY